MPDDWDIPPLPPAAPKGPGGRPTKYEARFCEMVIADMTAGYSIAAFAGSIGVARSSINEWMSVHPEFAEAVEIGKSARLRVWETQAISVARGAGTGGSAQSTMIAFGLKNMGGDDWADRQQLEHSGPGGKPIETVDVSARDVVASRIAGIVARKGAAGGAGEPEPSSS